MNILDGVIGIEHRASEYWNVFSKLEIQVELRLAQDVGKIPGPQVKVLGCELGVEGKCLSQFQLGAQPVTKCEQFITVAQVETCLQDIVQSVAARFESGIQIFLKWRRGSCPAGCNPLKQPVHEPETSERKTPGCRNQFHRSI